MSIGPTIENLRKKRAEEAALLERLYAPPPVADTEAEMRSRAATVQQRRKDQDTFGDTTMRMAAPYFDSAIELAANAGRRPTYFSDPIMGGLERAGQYTGDMALATLSGLLGLPYAGAGFLGEVFGGDESSERRLARDLAAGFDVSGVGPEARALGSIARTALSGRGTPETARGFLADESGSLPLPSKAPKTPKKDGEVKAPAINKLDPNEWLNRLEASLPAVWLDPKFDKPQWNAISNVSSDLAPSDMQPILRSTGTLEPEAVKTLEGLVGRTGIPALGDRSVAGNEILGIGNLTYKNAVRSLGGADFMREKGTGIWANATPQASDLATTASEVIREGGDPALIYTAMGPQSADFSTMMAEAVLNQYDPRMIDPEAARKYDAMVRKFVPNFTSILNPKFLDGLTGTDRWNLWQLMDKAELKKAGFPDINLARRSVTDPRLLNAVPFDAGLTIGRPTGALLLPNNKGLLSHPTYPSQLEGVYEGGLERSVPGAIVWRDFFNQRRASGAPAGSDQRSFLMNANKIKQNIDQQTIDEANQFFERLRGVNDPTDPLKLWRGLLSD